LRDALFIQGQSVGKFCFSLLVISVETGRPCGRGGSIRRNLLFLVPGLNVVAAVLETITALRDQQGQRLGDRLAQTQVVDGLGARELGKLLQKELLAIRRATAVEEPIEVERCVRCSSSPREVPCKAQSSCWRAFSFSSSGFRT
jgi:hypothetical protein